MKYYKNKIPITIFIIITIVVVIIIIIIICIIIIPLNKNYLHWISITNRLWKLNAKVLWFHKVFATF